MQSTVSTVLILMCFLLSSIVGDEECGKRNINPTLVTGGQDAGRGEFPWVAALYGRSKGSYVHFCGGTLIRTNIVITAAHCVYSESTRTIQNATAMKVALGKLYRDYNGDPPNSGVQVVDVESVTIPRRYRGVQFNSKNNIAVLKLASHVRITRAVNVACVDFNVTSDEDFFSNGTKGTVAGWGINNNHTVGPKTLQWLDLPWIDEDKCMAETEFRARTWITEDRFCAGHVNQTKSVCRGDSGGGYMVLKNGRYYLRGVSSSGLSHRHSDPSRCSAHFYTTFTSIAYHSQWVKREIGD